MNKRRGKLLIEPRFQLAFILRLSGWAGLATLVTAAALGAAILAAESRLSGALVYASGAEATALSLWHVLLPALAVALPLNLALTLFFALYYSRGLAGPVHRLGQDMLRLARGEKTELSFSLRESDELQELAHAFDALLKSLARKDAAKGT